MASDWPDWAIAFTAAAGIAGTAITAALGRTHAQQLAREQRRQDRIEAAYLYVLEHMAQWHQGIDMSLNPRAPLPPEPPSTGEQIRAAALIAVFASEDVANRWNSWLNAMNTVAETLREAFESGLEQQQGANRGDEVQVLIERCRKEQLPAAEFAYRAVAAAMSRELAEAPAPPPRSRRGSDSAATAIPLRLARGTGPVVRPGVPAPPPPDESTPPTSAGQR